VPPGATAPLPPLPSPGLLLQSDE